MGDLYLLSFETVIYLRTYLFYYFNFVASLF